MNIFSLGAPSWVVEALTTLWLMICKVIYSFIGFLYRVFDQVARINLFSTEVFKDITGRIYIVMGIAMLFIFAYNLVLMIINPDDKKGTGAMTKVVKETMISLIIIILLPTIFNYMYTFQNHILSSNIIGQIIMGGIGSTGDSCAPDDYECNCDFSNFNELDNYSGYHNGWIFKFKTGTSDDEKTLLKSACEYYRSDNLSDSTRGAYSIAPTIFSTFYRPANFNYSECADYLATGSSTKITSEKDKQICVNFYYDVNMSKYTGDIKPFVGDDYLNAILSDSDDSSMEFDWIWAFVAGGLAVWMFLCYAMEIGVRVAKLGVLQIISPITVMMRVVPGQKEKIYDKWFKNLLNTYLDVFIRLLIIYFALFAVSLVPDVVNTMFSSLWNNTGSATDFFVKILSTVILILGILKFAQEAPDLLKEFFGGAGKGGFSLRSPKKQLNENNLGKKVLGYAGGSVIGAASAIAQKTNPVTGFFRGGKNTAQSVGAADLTKKGAFTDAMKTGKQITDLQQSQPNKYVAFAKNVASGKTKEDFVNWLKNESVDEINTAASGLYSAFGDLWLALMKQWVDQEAQFKTNYLAGDPISLGNDYYTRKDDGRWYKNGTSESLDHLEMESEGKNYFKQQKAELLLQKLKNNDATDMTKLNNWTDNFMKAFEDKLPKLGTEFSKKFFNEIESVGGLKVSNLDELQTGIQNLRNSNDEESMKKLTNIYVKMEEVMKDKRDSTFKSYGDKKN